MIKGIFLKEMGIRTKMLVGNVTIAVGAPFRYTPQPVAYMLLMGGSAFLSHTGIFPKCAPIIAVAVCMALAILVRLQNERWLSHNPNSPYDVQGAFEADNMSIFVIGTLVFTAYIGADKFT